MRAVNLIPKEQRRGGLGAPGRSGTGVYVVLGALTALVVMVGAYVLAGNSVTTKRSELTKAKAEAQVTSAEAARLKPYQDFATLSQSRLQTVASLAASRFDWDGTIRQIARVLPARVQINTLKGTVNPQVQVESDSSSGGSTGSVRNTSQDPAIEITGCARNQSEVALVMSRLRLVDGTRRVTLVSSEKNEDTTSTAPAKGAAITGCPRPRALYQLVMFFAPLGGPATTPGSEARSQPVPAPPTSADVGGASGPAGTEPVSAAATP